MIADIGVAINMLLKTIIEIGIVAKQRFDASDCPANPAIVKIIGICEPNNPCIATKTNKLRRVLESVVAKVELSMPGCYRGTVTNKSVKSRDQ